MSKTFQKTFRIHAYEIDYHGKARFLSLINYLQDAAGEHAAALGLSIQELRRKQLTWLLSRYHIQVKEYPAWNSSVRVETWPSGREGRFALRDFEMRGEKNRVLLLGTTSWMLFDLQEKKTLQLEGHLPEGMEVARRAIPDAFQRLQKPEEPALESTFPVMDRDLDFNHHVNNTVYIQWALESVPENILKTMKPASVEVSYRAEAFYGETVLVLSQPSSLSSPEVFFHQVRSQKSGKELARLRTTWTAVRL